MINEILRAGHRHFGTAYLILVEDGGSPECDDPDLPPDVVRITVVTGREIDLTGSSADEFRRAICERSGPFSVVLGHQVHGHQVHPQEGPPPSSGRPVKAPRRGPRGPVKPK